MYLQDPTALVKGSSTADISVAELSGNGKNMGEVAKVTVGVGRTGIVNFECGPGMGVGFEVRGLRDEDGGALGFGNSYMAPAVGFFLSVCL